MADRPSERPLKVVRSAARGRRRDIAVGSVFVMLHQASEALVPIVIGLAIDRAVATGDGAALVRWIAVFAAVFGFLTTAGLVGYYTLERAQLWIAHDVRQLVVARVLDPRGGIHDRPGDVVSLASDDAETVGAVSWSLGLGLGAIPALIGGTAFLLVTSVPLGLVVVVGVPVVVAAVGVLSRPLVGRSEQEQAAAAAAAGTATDLLGGLRVVKGLGAEAAAAARCRTASRRSLAARLRAARFFAGYEGATIGVSGLLLVLVAWIGGRLAVDGDITIGELVAAVGLAQFLIGPLSLLVEAGGLAASVRAAGRRVRTLVERPVDVDDTSDHRPTDRAGAPALRLAGVASGPLRSIDLDVATGSVIGIVAEPAEATEILRMLGRRRDPTDGAVEVFGTHAADWPIDELRDRVMVCSHDSTLFDGSVREQVSVRAIDQDRVDAAITASTVTEVAEKLRDGLDSSVGERGRRLSGGQRQRVVLARALAADTDVLVLHDPTTAVDATTEHVIAERFARLRRNRSTTVVVTTSPALLAVCDEVVVIADGSVSQRGTHADLLDDAGYRERVLR